MSDHMKRLAAPRTWPLKRKVSVWATKQSPGAHSLESGMPAVAVLRDMIKICDTAKEAKRIISNRGVFVDGTAVKNPKASIGLMDTVSIPAMGLNYRMLLTDKGKLSLVPVSEDEAKWKLCRIEGKTKVSGGKIQLNLSSGRNIILDKNMYKSGDTLRINTADQTVLDSYALADGASALIISGALAGKVYTVADCVTVKGPSDNIVRFQSGTETVKRNVFVIGSSKPEIKLPEASE
ncbi:MAG: 30S ribosomal protein S4e [Candidatus Methanoplasma sp.]|jgi:small subunit ribosomal protein S4e|nr:30S ribosomal protein S4e [Candidatus Methanoplasma sp.]